MANSAYSPYIDALRQVLKTSEEERGLKESKGFSTPSERERFRNQRQTVVKNLRTASGIEGLAALLKLPVRSPRTGDHPDFSSIRQTGNPINHYIVSMFMDVRNSTALFRRYDDETVYDAIQIIVLAALQTCALFGGHIERMQYDGVFVYFGGRRIPKADAVRASIDAASFFSYFVKYELVKLLDEVGMEKLSARTGIDFGDDNETLWGVFGMDNCTELTTTSLHTSLAPKMQHCAPRNGIMVGENIKKLVGLPDEYFDLLRLKDSDNVDEGRRYIFENPNYTQHVFNWEEYLVNTFSFVQKIDGKVSIDYTGLPAVNERLNGLQHKLDLVTATGSINSLGKVSDKPSHFVVPSSRNYCSDL